MVASGWTLFNTPTFDARGMILNGTTQYGTIPLQREFSSAELTVHLEFYPDFAHDDGVQHYFLDAETAGNPRFLIRKAANGVLQVYCGALTNIVYVAAASYGSYWVNGGRNILSLSTISGTNVCMLNGHQLTNTLAATAWVPKAYDTLTVGSAFDGSDKFPGAISRLYAGAHTSTLAEHTAVYNNTMWNWENRCTVDLQFRTDDYDIANVRTLDSSGNGNHATLGDGSTPTTYPTQGAGRMTFDGGDYLQIPADATLPSGTYTVLMAFNPVIDGTSDFLFDADSGGGAGNCFVWSVSGNYAFTSGALYRDGAGPYATNILAGTAGIQTLVFQGITLDIAAHLTIFANDSFASTLKGTLFDFKIIPETLNQTQIIDYHSKVMRRMGAEE